MNLIETQLYHDKILSFNPQEVDLDFLNRYQILDLVSQGYDFRGTPVERAQRARGEFDQDLDNPVVHATLHPNDKSRVGALLILGRPTYPEKSRLSGLWENVFKLNDNLRQVHGGELRALEIGGVFIAKDHPRRGTGGAADQLLQSAIRLYSPHVVIGLTSSDKAMRWRIRVLDKLGYLTKINGHLFGDGWTFRLQDIAQTIASGYIPIHGENKAGYVLVSNEYLRPQSSLVPPKDPDRPYEIAKLLQAKQHEISASQTAAVVVVSIIDEFHLLIKQNQYF